MDVCIRTISRIMYLRIIRTIGVKNWNKSETRSCEYLINLNRYTCTYMGREEK